MTDVAVSANPDGAPRGNRRTRTDEIGGRISNHTRIGISFDPPQQAAGERRHYDQRHRKPDWRTPHRWLHIVAAWPRLAATVALFQDWTCRLDSTANPYSTLGTPAQSISGQKVCRVVVDIKKRRFSVRYNSLATSVELLGRRRPFVASDSGAARSTSGRGFGFHRDLSLREGRQARISAHSLPVTRRSSAGVSGNTENGVPAAAHTVVKRWRSASSSSVTGCACPSGATPPIV